jgi:hypothetical protein
MRVIVILLCFAGLSTASVSADVALSPVARKPAIEQPKAHSRCAKRIVLGADRNVVACLMQKRRGATEH